MVTLPQTVVRQTFHSLQDAVIQVDKIKRAEWTLAKANRCRVTIRLKPLL